MGISSSDSTEYTSTTSLSPVPLSETSIGTDKPQSLVGLVSVGTSSWNFPDWKGVFYPQALPNKMMLQFYASRFQSVEVNTSFYALPKPTTLIQWVESVPPGFTFALKAPRTITHEKRLVNCQSEMLSYLDALRSLGEAAAPGLLQLPPNLSRQQNGRDLARFLDWVAPELSGLRLAVEVRSADLMTPAFTEFLLDRKMTLTLVDRIKTPDLFSMWVDAAEAGPMPNFCLIRWIGDDQDGPSGNQEMTNPRDEDLGLWAKRILQLAQRGISVYGYMHNPYEGHSPASVQRLVTELVAEIPFPIWPPEGWQWSEAEGESQGKKGSEQNSNGNQLSLFDLT
ncbi:MAG: DUF72 domain-containing protein [Chloroflexota bacterium]